MSAKADKETKVLAQGTAAKWHQTWGRSNRPNPASRGIEKQPFNVQDNRRTAAFGGASV
jgi:hypothetical protein